MKNNEFKVRYDEIAKLAGVSKSTVSRVFNHPEKVSEATKQIVYDVVNKLNFHPNVVARSLRLKKTNTIGMIIPDITNSFFSELVKGVQINAYKNNYTVFIGNSLENDDMENEIIQGFLSRKVDGLIIVTTSTFPKYLNELNVPTIFVDRIISDDSFPQITSDNEKGGYIGLKYLISKRRKNILVVHGPLKFTNIPKRLEGCKKACEEYNRLNPHENVTMDTYELSKVSISAGEYVGTLILRNIDKYDAIFALSDLLALGILKKIKKYIKIGHEISLLGYDDIKEDRFVDPELSTIRQDKFGMGKIAFDFVFSMVKGEKLIKNKIFLPVKVVERMSS